MAMQEQNAASKVRELAAKLESAEKAKKGLEDQLQAEMRKVANAEAMHQEGESKAAPLVDLKHPKDRCVYLNHF